MKKHFIIASLLLIGVLLYNSRFLLKLGYDYLTWKPPISSEDIVKDAPIENPLAKYIDPSVDSLETPAESTDGSDQVDTKLPSGTTESNMETTTPVIVVQNVNEQHAATNNPQSDNAPQQPTISSISNDYNNKFIGLENDFKNSLDGLIDTALSDYASGQFTRLELAKIYLKKGDALENTVDEKFYALLSSFESELSSNGFDTSIVKDIDAYYITMKKAEKSRIVSKGMDLVKSKN